MSKVLERIDCYFEDIPEPIHYRKHYRLARVKFIPVPLVYKHGDSELNHATDRIQEGLIGMDKEKDGVKVEYAVNFHYEGLIRVDSPAPFPLVEA